MKKTKITEHEKCPMNSTRKKTVYVTMPEGLLKKELVPMSFTDIDIIRFLHMKYGRTMWVDYRIMKVA